MQKRKVAAVLAAVELYLQQEAEAAAAAVLPEPVLPAANSGGEAGMWVQSGRLDMMNGRRMIQMRAFAGAR